MWWTYVLALGAVMAAIGIGGGAFGAHGLKDRLNPADMAIFETAARYWMYHSLGMIAVALVMTRIENWFIKISTGSMFLGALLFSGSLVALVLTGQRHLGAITPIGGAFLILAWLLLGVGVVFHS